MRSFLFIVAFALMSSLGGCAGSRAAADDAVELVSRTKVHQRFAGAISGKAVLIVDDDDPDVVYVALGEDNGDSVVASHHFKVEKGKVFMADNDGDDVLGRWVELSLEE